MIIHKEQVPYKFPDGRNGWKLITSYINNEGKVAFLQYPIPQEQMFEWKYATRGNADPPFYEYDYKDAQKNIYEMMVPSWEKLSQDDGDDFYSNINSKMTHTKLIVFGAVIEFIEAFETFDVDTFKQWMRIVWNVIENTNIDSLTPVSSLIRKFSAVIHSIARRMSEGDTFYYALSQWKEDNTDERENRALLEEVLKASCIADNTDWLPVFVDAEQHPFFRGMVMFFYKEDMSLEDYQYSLSLAKNMFDESGI
jgi:hypothetical protein